MSRFLFTTLPTNDLGLIARSLPIAEVLRDSGHDVTFCSPGRSPMRLVADAGFRNVLPPHPLFDLMADETNLRGLARLLLSERWRERYSSRREVLRRLVPAVPRGSAPGDVPPWNVDHAGAQMGMSHLGFVRACTSAMIEVIGRDDVDVVVDFWNPVAAIAARAAGKPIVTVIQADAHPASKGFIWWREPPPDLPSPVATVNRILEELGLRPISTLADLSVGDLTLVVGTPRTDPLPAGAKVTYIGPSLWQQPDAELPEWVDRLGRHRPLIWVYSGNPRYGGRGSEGPMDSAVVIRSAAGALGGMDLDVVLTTGNHDLPPELVRGLPANFHHAGYLPGLALAERCDLLIHHGGHGSCQTGLLSGTPSVIMPTFAERESNARRVAALDAGRIVPVRERRGRKSVDVDLLRRTVIDALSDDEMLEAARAVGRDLSSYGGPRTAAGRISDFARSVTHVMPEQR